MKPNFETTRPRLRPTPPLIALGLFAYGASTYLAFHLYRLHSLPTPPPEISDPKHQKTTAEISTPEVYSKIADSYDDDVGWDEWFLGMDRRRRNVVQQLKGSVIETAAGTGRNLRFFAETNPSDMTSITLTDASPQMLQRAFETYKTYSKDLPPVTFSLLNISHSDVSPPAIQYSKFDTVFQTFGLCSMQDPSTSLEAMKQLCKPDGRIILLEHGRSLHSLGFLSDWINGALDKTAQGHADRWGCWWNRDLERVVRGIEGVEVLSVKRFHLGTTLEIVLKRTG
ncbi:UNVERIFIED_CONTAM: hypothetical protein HDU68_005628 [Siphonaria sp. JEL0065]|nr:hypothetical protein HDU68_005628 [Siphonaria sp. JEL0065]